MGVLTWMFVDGHGSGLMNYTPQPLMAPMIGLIIAVIWGLSTDYEVFLVSRMVEARERGMSTAEAIRIGTATTGRLITGAALILAVVAGAFVFSDLVMMKYLAFGLLIALLLDATVVRMFLVPGDHEAARRRLLVGAAVDEADSGPARPRRDRAARRAQAARRSRGGAGAGRRRCTAATRPLPPHDPTHPAVEGSSRPGAATTRTQPAPPRANGPSVAGTTRMPTPRTAQADEPPTTRLPTANKKKSRNAVPNSTASHPALKAPNAAATRTGGPRNRVVAGRIARQQPWRRHRRPRRGRAHSRMPSRPPRFQRSDRAAAGRPRRTAEPTTAIPAQRQPDPETTEKLTRAGGRRRGRPPQRRGVSAQDLLRREGRRL